MDSLQIKINLTGAVLERFMQIKQSHGLTTDAETVRMCIAKFPHNGEGGE